MPTNAPLLLAAALIAGCALDSGPVQDPSPGGKADDLQQPADFGCQNVGGISLDELVGIDDPIAAFLIKAGDSCPSDYGELVEKLRQVDPAGCTEGDDLVTRIVSDDARLDPNPSNYRTVTSRNCGSRDAHELLWTLLGVRADEDISRRTFIEMQALDRNTGLYNYYVFSGGSFSFEGDSQAAVDGDISCGGCHRGGGVLMKELDRPWIHWESGNQLLAGVDEMFENHGALFGARGNGAELEQLVRTGNDSVIDARIRAQSNPATGSVHQLLEPLFCHQQINIDAAGTSPGAPVVSIPADALVDPHLATTPVPVDPDVYADVLAAEGSRVPGIAGATDTAFGLAFPERSGIDNAYVDALVAAGIVDSDFVADVLAIDFTDPLFSDDRCGLLSFAPEYGDAAAQGLIAQANPASVRDAFIAALSASSPAPGSPAAQLLANLSNPDDEGAHRARAAAFLQACSERPHSEMLTDVLRTIERSRQRLRSTSLIEHSEQMSQLSNPAAFGQRLDPETCELR